MRVNTFIKLVHDNDFVKLRLVNSHGLLRLDENENVERYNISIDKAHEILNNDVVIVSLGTMLNKMLPIILFEQSLLFGGNMEWEIDNYTLFLHTYIILVRLFDKLLPKKCVVVNDISQHKYSEWVYNVENRFNETYYDVILGNTINNNVLDECIKESLESLLQIVTNVDDYMPWINKYKIETTYNKELINRFGDSINAEIQKRLKIFMHYIALKQTRLSSKELKNCIVSAVTKCRKVIMGDFRSIAESYGEGIGVISGLMWCSKNIIFKEPFRDRYYMMPFKNKRYKANIANIRYEVPHYNLKTLFKSCENEMNGRILDIFMIEGIEHLKTELFHNKLFNRILSILSNEYVESIEKYYESDTKYDIIDNPPPFSTVLMDKNADIIWMTYEFYKNIIELIERKV